MNDATRRPRDNTGRWSDVARRIAFDEGGMAHVERRTRRRTDGTAEVTWRGRYRAPDGRERSRTFRTKAEVQRWLTSVETSKANGEWIDPKLARISCGEYIDGWLATKSAVSPATRLNIASRVSQHIRPYFGDMRVGAVRPVHARQFVAHLTALGLAPASVKSIALTASQIFSQAVDDALIARSPFSNVALPRDRHHQEMRFLNAPQVNALAAVIDERYRAAVYLAAYGGLRAGELWGLRVDRLNLAIGTVDITVAMSEAGGLHVGPTKTGRRRTIQVPRFLATMLTDHVVRYPSADGWLFTAGEGARCIITTSGAVTTNAP